MTVPKLPNKFVNILINKLSLTEGAVYVDIELNLDGEVNECFQNVEQKVNLNGGRQITNQ